MFENDICTISICRSALSTSGWIFHSLKHKINLNCWILRLGFLLGKETSPLALSTITLSVSADLSFLFSIGTEITLKIQLCHIIIHL